MLTLLTHTFYYGDYICYHVILSKLLNYLLSNNIALPFLLPLLILQLLIEFIFKNLHLINLRNFI